MTPLIDEQNGLDDRFQKAMKAMPVSTRASNPTGFHNFNIDVTDVNDEVEKPNDISEILPQDTSGQLNDNSFLLTINDAFKYHNASQGDFSTPNRRQRCKYKRTRLIEFSRIFIIWLWPPKCGSLLPKWRFYLS